MKKKELSDTLQKYVKDKVLNVTAKEVKGKPFSCFPHTLKCHSLYSEVSQSIEYDDDFKFHTPWVGICGPNLSRF